MPRHLLLLSGPPGGIAEHQDVVFGIPVFRGYREMLCFCPHLLSGNQCNVGINLVLSPLSDEVPHRVSRRQQ